MEHPIHRDLGSSTDVATLDVAVPLVSGEACSETLRGRLTYTTADPYAVSLLVETSSSPVTWTFSRELLGEGIYEPVGDGDVQVWPCLSVEAAAVIIIELHAPSGDALLQTPTRTVQRFIEETYRVVPAGTESAHLGLDALVAELLAD